MKEFSRVDKKAKTKWRITRFIGLVVLAGISAGIFLALKDETGLFLLAAICCGAVLLLQLVNLLVYPFIEYIQWAYLIDDDRIEIKKGIFWRSHTVIPISRIQHVCAKSGPVQSMFKLASVEIHTAGGNHTIDELNKETANEICELLKNIVNLKVAEQRAIEQIREKKAAQSEVQQDA